MDNSGVATGLEPSDEWKRDLKKRIEKELGFMVKDAKDQLESNIQRNPGRRNQLIVEHQSAMGNIRRLAEEQFREELQRERQERRWAAGMPLENKWLVSLREEQDVIFQRIKRSGSKEPAPTDHSSTVRRTSPQSGSGSNTASQPPTGAAPSQNPPERWVPMSKGDVEDEDLPAHLSFKTRNIGVSHGAQRAMVKPAAEGPRCEESEHESVRAPGQPPPIGVAKLAGQLKSTLMWRIHDDIGRLVQFSTEWLDSNICKVEGDDGQQLRSQVEEYKHLLAKLRNLASELFDENGATAPAMRLETHSREEPPAVVGPGKRDFSAANGAALVKDKAPEVRQGREKILGRRQGDIPREVEPESDAEELAKGGNGSEEVATLQLERSKNGLARKPESSGRARAISPLKGDATSFELPARSQVELQTVKTERALIPEEEVRKRQSHEQERLRRMAEEIGQRVVVAGGGHTRQGFGTWGTSEHPVGNSAAQSYLAPPPRSFSAMGGADHVHSTRAMINHPRSNATPTHKPRTGSFGSSFPRPDVGGSGSLIQSRAEWALKRANLPLQQQEQFRQEQEILARREADRERMARRRN